VSTNDNLYFDIHNLKSCYIMLCSFEKNVYLGDHVTPLIWNKFFSPSIVVVVNDELLILIVVPWGEKTKIFRYRLSFLSCNYLMFETMSFILNMNAQHRQR
jgi:hypothetical protein